MAKRHDENPAGRSASPDETTSDDHSIDRRTLLRQGSAAALATVGPLLGVSGTATAGPDDVVDLGEEGLEEGDVVDEFLEDHFEDGVEVRIPEGEYDWEGDGFDGATEDAAVVGEDEVVFDNVGGEYDPGLVADDGEVRIENITVRGEAGPDKSRFRLEARSDGRIVVENVNFPDGSEDGAKSKAFYVPGDHAGEIEIRNCYIEGFSDNGIYASPPGDGEDGRVVVEDTEVRNVNISGIRIGTSDSVVRDCLVVNDEEVPEHSDGSTYQRGIWVRESGEDITIENCEIVHSREEAGPPIRIAEEAEGGSGSISDTEIRNDSDSKAIKATGDGAEDWTASDVTISGDGNLDYPSHLEDVTVDGD